jgi:hypothetical protein
MTATLRPESYGWQLFHPLLMCLKRKRVSAAERLHTARKQRKVNNASDLIQTTLRRTDHDGFYEEELEEVGSEEESSSDCEMEAYSAGTLLHSCKSRSKLARILRSNPPSIHPLLDIFDAGDTQEPYFLANLKKWMPTLSREEQAQVLKRFAGLVILSLEDEYNRHEEALLIVIKAISDPRVIRMAISVAKTTRCTAVVQVLLQRLHELDPQSAKCSKHELKKFKGDDLSEEAQEEQDERDEEKDNQLASLEEEMNSEDKDFIDKHDDVKDYFSDGEYVINSEEESDSDDSVEDIGQETNSDADSEGVEESDGAEEEEEDSPDVEYDQDGDSQSNEDETEEVEKGQGDQTEAREETDSAVEEEYEPLVESEDDRTSQTS